MNSRTTMTPRNSNNQRSMVKRIAEITGIRRIPAVLTNAAVIFVSAVISAVLILSLMNRTVSPARAGNAAGAADATLPGMRETDLAPFDGRDPTKPIYIGLDGYVYDVTAGASFYKPGGSYHFLAGRDSSAELHFAGAAIIRKKYPVVAKLVL